MHRGIYLLVLLLVLGSIGLYWAASDTASSAAPTTKVFHLTVKDGRVVEGSGDIQVLQGDTVTLSVTNDTDEELHLHGYNLMTSLSAGEPGTIRFTASASGRYPFELEESKTELGAISVLPR